MGVHWLTMIKKDHVKLYTSENKTSSDSLFKNAIRFVRPARVSEQPTRKSTNEWGCVNCDATKESPNWTDFQVKEHRCNNSYRTRWSDLIHLYKNVYVFKISLAIVTKFLPHRDSVQTHRRDLWATSWNWWCHFLQKCDHWHYIVTHFEVASSSFQEANKSFCKKNRR